LRAAAADCSTKISWCVLLVVKKEPVTTVDWGFCTQDHPAWNPLVAGTIQSSRVGVFA